VAAFFVLKFGLIEVKNRTFINNQNIKARHRSFAPEEWNKTAIISEADIHVLAGKLHLSPAIVAGRWQRETGSYRKFARLLGRGQVRCQFDV